MMNMDLWEYQGKRILQRIGVTSPKATLVCLCDQELSNVNWNGGEVMTKVQLLAGKRGLSGGVIPAFWFNTKDKILQLLGNFLRTGDSEERVISVLIEEKIKVNDEMFVSLVVSRLRGSISLLVSQFGGMDIERNASVVTNVSVRTYEGLKERVVYEVMKLWNLRCQLKCGLLRLILKVFRLFLRVGLLTAEINPLVISNNELVAVDSKMNLDENDLPQESNWESCALSTPKESNALRDCATQYKISYIPTGINGIGCVVNGAGLAMMTMDAIADLKGESLNFLDVGGRTSVRKITKSLVMVCWTGIVKAMLINIFGGIVSCTIIAKGMLNFVKLRGYGSRIVVRLEGTNGRTGSNILLGSGIRTQCLVVSFDSVVRESLGTCRYVG